VFSGISSSLSSSYPAGATEALDCEILPLEDDELTELDEVPLEISF
jgi:hypothetical protein